MKSLLLLGSSALVHAARSGEKLATVTEYVAQQVGTHEFKASLTADSHVWELEGLPGTCRYHLRGYDGGTGPTFRVDAGDTLHMKFKNDLVPDTLEAAEIPVNQVRLFNTTNLHTHGLQISPEAPSDDVFLTVEGGDSYDYTFQIPANHAPGSHWYHGHHHGSTYLQVMSGSIGSFIVNDDKSQTPAWVQAMPEVVMQVRTLEPKGFESLHDVTPDHLWSQSDTSGCPDNLLLVNSQHEPRVSLVPGEWTRLRVLNAGPMKHLALLVPAGCEVWILSMDGIYLTRPQRMPTSVDDPSSDQRPIFMAAGNRRDLAVMCPNAGSFELRSSDKFTADFPIETSDNCNAKARNYGDGGDTFGGLVATFEVSGPRKASQGPASGLWFSQEYLRPSYLSGLADEHPEAYGVNVYTTNNGNQINGRSFNHAVPEWTLPLGKVFEMTIMSMRGGGHPYHQHVSPFQVQESTFNYTAIYGFDLVGTWHDTLLSAEGCSLPVRFVPKFPGKFTVHCHLLKHEDLGMMLYGEIVDDNPQSHDCAMACAGSGGRHLLFGADGCVCP